MTREEIMTLGMDELEERKSAIATETDEADAEKLDALNAELEAIEERTKALNLEIEESRKAAEEVARGAGKEIETRKEDKKMTDMEIRNSHEYIEAFAKYVKTGEDMECRKLLTDNATNGTVPVPSFAAEIVAERLKESKILSRVRRMEAPGNVKVGFEIDAPLADIHFEGTEAMAEEALTLGIVTLTPLTFKKWVQISDEALDSMSGEAYLSYIYDEVARGIIKDQEKELLVYVTGAPATPSRNQPAVQKTGADPAAITDFVNARALLSSAAEELVIIVSPSDYAMYKGLQMAANYGVDPFDGLEVIVSEYADKPIIGDLSGLMINYPNGSAIEFKYDDKTLMTEDMVRVLGRQPAGMGLVGNNFFAMVSA